MKLMESRAVRVVLAWIGVTLALKGLAWLVIWAGIPPTSVADLQAQLVQFQSDTWALVVALILKWAMEDYAKWIPVQPPQAPQNVAGGDIHVAAPPAKPAPPGERK